MTWVGNTSQATNPSNTYVQDVLA